MDRMSVRYFQTALDSRTVEETAEGVKLVKSVPVFRAGTFKDSMGDQHTWEYEHLAQMVFHFGMLNDRDILPNVPIRDGHRSFFGGGGEVVGYVIDLRVEGADTKGNQLLVADMEITEPEAFAKIERGTWRSRSSEIGFYETNDEVMYWPVFMGVAWVDIPAVEGLFSKNEPTDDKFTPVRDNEEGAVSHAKTDANKGGGSPGTPDPNAGTKEHTAPPAATKEGKNGNEGAEGGDEASGKAVEHAKGEPATGAATAGTVTTTVTTPAEHGNQPTTFEFTLDGGTKTNDFAAVQVHIENLESVLNENRNQARKDFVTSLASSSRIAATQVDAMQAHALTLSDEQYEAFVKMYEGAPESPLFAHHGQGTTTEPDESASEVETLRERVKMHKRSGMPEKKVKDTGSYKRLMELTDNKG